MGDYRFGVPRELVLWLKQTFGLQQFVETGTNRAETAVWASDHFEQVTTIEGFPPLYETAREEFGSVRNVEFLLGDSRQHLQRIIPKLPEPAIFWLDAHWCGDDTFGQGDECPVLAELQLINASTVGHFVLIDDARLFLAPPPPPHVAPQWPDLWEVCSQLREHASERYIAVHEDVIIGVPGSAKQELVEYLRTVSDIQVTTGFQPRAQTLLDKLRTMRVKR